MLVETATDFDGEPMEVDGSPKFLAIRLPSREHPRYKEAVELLKHHGFLLEPSNRKWWLRDRHKTLSFLAEYKEELKERFGAHFTENFERNFRDVAEAEVRVDGSGGGNAFRLEMEIRAPGVDSKQLQTAAGSGRPFLETNSGRIVLLPRRKLQRLTELRQALTGKKERAGPAKQSVQLSAAELAPATELIETLLPGHETPGAWRERSEALRNLSRLQQAPLPDELDGSLRLYQKIGVAWLYHVYRHRLGGILADEMGLGKTLQALCLIEAARGNAAENERRPSLIVCPASLTENWRREAEKFAPHLRVFVHHRASRMAGAEEFGNFDAVITTYSTLQRDLPLFAEAGFDCVIGDEAQHIKNRRTANARALASVQSRARFLLTGTPIENSLSDLVSLFAFLMPGYLQPIPSDAQGDTRTWHEDRLRKRAAPYILRRTKQQVAPELPEKIETVFYCDFDEGQRAFYETIREKARRELLADGAAGEKGGWKLSALTQLLRLRQACCDPRLIEKAWNGGVPAKLAAIREIVDEAIDDGHRMLVFSQFVSALQLLKADLDERDIPYTYLDGQTRDRLAVCDRFNNDASIPVFLISLKAGGAGLNLTGADTVVHFDPWWNPAVEAQATDRAHRTGQTRTVTSIKLIAAGTVEEKVLALQEKKRAMLAGVFDETDAGSLALEPEDVEALLE